MSEASLPREILHREGFYPEESSGLFVGISSFVDDSFAAVPFAVDDAVDLAWVFVLHLQLVDPKRTVLALAGEPRKQTSQERLEALLQAGAKRENAGLTQLHRLVSAVGRKSGPRGLFVLTAATHGLSDQGGDYLVATDSVRDSLLDTALKLPKLFDRIAQLPARRRLVLLDACRERLNQHRSVAEADPAMAARFASAISKAVGQTVLMASVAGGFSYDDTKKENGVFSGALVDGLCGSALADSEGLITVGAVAEYVRDRVQAFVREYRPTHVSQSRGIEERYDEKARELPLAIDPARTRALEAYRLRRAAAVEQLHRNIGGDLDGHRIEDIKDLLPTAGLPNAEVEELLTEIEALDGSARSKRSVLFLFEKLRPGRRLPEPVAPQPAVPVEPPLVAVVPPVSQPVPQPPPQTTLSSVPVNKPETRNMSVGQRVAWLERLAVSVLAVVLVNLLVGWLIGGEKVKPYKPMAAVDSPPAKQPEVQAEPKAGARILDSFGMAYRYIPGGKYTIGSPDTDKERYGDETQRDVSVKGFWLAETEMTQAEWKRHGFTNPSRFDTCGNCPVEQVSRYEAVMFANELSRIAGLEACYEAEFCIGTLGTSDYHCKDVKPKSEGCEGYRLPTEEEWEVAARAQLPGSAYRARYGELDVIAWHSGNSGAKTHPVGTKAANAWGLHDMLGNVWEWTNSTYPTDLDSRRVYRGGSWFDQAGLVRAADRDGDRPGTRSGLLGFRFSLGRPRSSQEQEGRGAL